MWKSIIVAVVFVFAVYAAYWVLGQHREKAVKSGGAMPASFVAETPAHKPPQGYFQLSPDGKRVYIQSFDGTIKLTFPRGWHGRFSALSKEEQDSELKEAGERIWPIDNPAFTAEFREWIDRVQYVSEAGVVPDKLP